MQAPVQAGWAISLQLQERQSGVKQYDGSGPIYRFAVLFLTTVVSLYSQELSHTTAPRVVHRVEPEYTAEALDAKIEGVVILSVMVGVNGVPSDIKVVRGLGKGLDEKAVECVRQWRFAPATNFGEAVSVKATVELGFRLSPSANSK